MHSRRGRNQRLWAFAVEDPSDLLAVLLRVEHQLCHFLSLTLELFLCVAAFFLFFCDPLVQLEVLALERTWWNHLLVIFPVNLLLLIFLVVCDGFFAYLQHLGVVLRVKILGLELSRTHELAECITLEYRSACRALRVSLRAVWVSLVERCCSGVNLKRLGGYFQMFFLFFNAVWVMRSYLVQRKLGNWLFDALTLPCGIARTDVWAAWLIWHGHIVSLLLHIVNIDCYDLAPWLVLVILWHRWWLACARGSIDAIEIEMTLNFQRQCVKPSNIDNLSLATNAVPFNKCFEYVSLMRTAGVIPRVVKRLLLRYDIIRLYWLELLWGIHGRISVLLLLVEFLGFLRV